MSIIEPDINEAFTVRVQSYDVGNPSQKWSNNYVLFNAGGGVYTDLIQGVNNILLFHKAVTYQDVVTERAVVSTRISDSNPYNGDEFTAVELNASGDRAATTASRLALEVCLFLRKNVQTGRTGKLFIRGALQETDVQFGQSLFSLTSAVSMTSVINTALISSNLEDNLSGGTGLFSLALYTTTPTSVTTRLIDDLTVAGVRMVNMNKRYYNRA